MRMEWQNPIYHVKAQAFNPTVTEKALTDMTSAVLAAYSHFIRTNRDSIVFNSWDRNGVNHAFFRWQEKGGWEQHLGSHPAMKPLGPLFHFAADVYLNAVGMPKV